MTRSRRSWQGLGLLLGLAGTVLFLSGQGCPMSPTPGSELDPIEESNTDQLQSDDASTKDVGGPTAQVIFPNGGEQVETNTLVEVRVFARHPSIPDPLIRVFYDRDSSSANGNVTIGTIKASQGGIGWDLTGLGVGTYWIGAELVGVTPAVIDYSDAAFQVVPAGQGGSDDPGGDDDTDKELMLTVSTPANTATLFQGRTFSIRWSTSLLPGEGTAVIFTEPDFDEDNVPDGQALRDTIGSPGIDAAAQKVDFDTTGVVGNFFIGVTVTANDGRTATAYSTGTLKVLAPALWTGDVATKRDERGRELPQTGAFQGARIKGVQPQDNLGTAMIPADDYDGDGFNEIVFAAQFGKSFFFADGGRGTGEAYMVYGSSQRLRGDIEANSVGTARRPGVVFPGIVPNPFAANEPGGNPVAFEPEGVNGAPPVQAGRFATEGLRSLAFIPDQDNDGKGELVFGFPWCNSISLENQDLYGIYSHGEPWLGRLENDGHFLRGGTVIVSSTNSVMNNRDALSAHNDRVIQLQRVGQVFAGMGISPDLPEYRGPQDLCTARNPNLGPPEYQGGADTVLETVTFPCEGFYQNTLTYMDPPRLADPYPAVGLTITRYAGYGCEDSYIGGPFYVSLDQVDPVPSTTSMNYFEARQGFADNTVDDYCKSIQYPPFGYMSVLGSGFYGSGNTCATRVLSQPMEPYGCRILGQTTTQLYTSPPTTANRFATSLSVSGDFLVIGAPMRTAKWSLTEVPYLPEMSREESGVVYMMSLKRRGMPAHNFPWSLPAVAPQDDVPAPHNYIIKDLGYKKTDTASNCDWTWAQNGPEWEIGKPIQIIGANAKDRIGDSVAGLYDVNYDGVDDVAVGGAGTNDGRGAVYLLYRRQPELEHDYLLERLQLPPSDKNRLTGLFIIGERGENLGTALAATGPAELNDDFNNDGFADLLIGSPNATPAAGFEAGQAFILFGGKTILNNGGGVTLAQLRANNSGMLLTGAQGGDRAGEVVANAGDVNGDGVADLMIAAPNATVPDLKFRNPGQDSLRSLRVSFQYVDGEGVTQTGIGIDRNGDGKADPLNDNNELDVNGNIIYDADDDLTDAGVVYVVFGGAHLKGTIKLDEIGTKALPGFVLVGRASGDELGAGLTQNNYLSRGLNRAGDLDGDGREDLMVSSILADPDGKTSAGEIYVVYGFAP